MENKIYTFNVDGKNFFVSTEEINAIYGRQYGLTEKDIEKYAARYVAQLKNYQECPKWLDKELVLRLIGEERLMKNGEADGFKLQLTFAWYVELRKKTSIRSSIQSTHIVWIIYKLSHADTRQYKLHCFIV